MTVLDVGANIGSFSLHAAALGLHVHAFEMQPELVMLVELSKRANGFTKLHVHNAALWHESGVPISFTKGSAPPPYTNPFASPHGRGETTLKLRCAGQRGGRRKRAAAHL